MAAALKSLVFLQLNELNFDLIREYLSRFPGRFSGFEKLLKCKCIITSAEDSYNELEPWIQWASIHTGKTYQEHGLYRLGDIVGTKVPQVFEKIESAGFSVGCISPMNAENRLKNPAYFLPDPWTKTASDDSFWSRELSASISQAVNDNSQSKIEFKHKLVLLMAMLNFIRCQYYLKYLKLIISCFRAPWRKALVLDILLNKIHTSFFCKKRPDFSSLFLNAGAHIQHHYLFNSPFVQKKCTIRNPDWYIARKFDPFLEMIEVYDDIVHDCLTNKECEYIVATALSQRPYDRLKYYYRLKNHHEFLRKLGLDFLDVYPRMTRDFLITFSSTEEALVANRLLAQLKIYGKTECLFGEIENRGRELFVVLTYPSEILKSDFIVVNDELKICIYQEVVFVAIKNGMHQSKGFAFFSPGICSISPKDKTHVKDLYGAILNYFSIAENN